MDYTFQTIASVSNGEYKEKGSKFIAYAFPVKDEEDVKIKLAQIKDEHPSSRHVCYAYKIGVNTNEKYRINDDGEPSGSAGQPIYGQILSYELTNVLVAVVRYFGGTKLGVGGLIKAYKEAAKLALDENEIIQKELTKDIAINYPYEGTTTLNILLNKYSLSKSNENFGVSCSCTIEIPLSIFDEVVKQLENQPLIKIIDQ